MCGVCVGIAIVLILGALWLTHCWNVPNYETVIRVNECTCNSDHQ